MSLDLAFKFKITFEIITDCNKKLDQGRCPLDFTLNHLLHPS